MSIPKIIHQTYKSKKIPAAYRLLQKRVIDLHPGWSYRLYDDKDCYDLLKDHLQTFLPIFDGYAHNIMRVDVFRIIAVYLYGGFYLDLLVLKKLDPLCAYNCIFAEEKTLTEQQARELHHIDQLRIANYMFGSVPGHPFLLEILIEMAKNSQRRISAPDDILEATGPGLITTVYHHTKTRYKDITILNNKDRICPKPFCRSISCHFGNYGMHHHFGTWRWNEDSHISGRSSKPKQPTPSLIKKITSELRSKFKSVNLNSHLYTLKTYHEDKYDGLTTVYHQVKEIGVVKTSTKHLVGKKVIVCGVPFLYLDKISNANKNVIYTTFETTELPDFWTNAINNHYKFCIVPHQHIKKVFKNSNVKIPIKIIPQGFNRYKRFYRKTISPETFRVGFLGVPVPRKNLFKLFFACQGLLAKIPTLKLSIHVSKFYEWSDNEAYNEIKNSPFVEWSECVLSDDQLSEWYGKLSCYIFPTSGEGWSFTPRESMYLGIPTIISNIPVHRELVKSNFYKVIRTRGLEDAKFHNSLYGRWHKVDISDIENAILDVFRNFSGYQEKALSGSIWIQDKWTQEQTRHQVFSFMNSL